MSKINKCSCGKPAITPKGKYCYTCRHLLGTMKKDPDRTQKMLVEMGYFDEMEQEFSKKYPGAVFLKCAKDGEYIAKIYPGRYREAAALTFMNSKSLKQALQDKIAEIKQLEDMLRIKNIIAKQDKPGE